MARTRPEGRHARKALVPPKVSKRTLWSVVVKGGDRGERRSTSSVHDLSTDEPTTPARILVVDDDAALALMLADVLELAGYEVIVAGTGAAARAEVELQQPELIILDLILPDEDGLVLCTVLKNMVSVPILICSGTRRHRDAFLSLKLGADDFIAKPFDAYNLLARVEVLLRRAPRHDAVEPNTERGPIRIGNLQVDHALHQVTAGETFVQLTSTEYRLLTVLAARRDQVVPRDLLARLVWGADASTSRTMDVHIARLRAKLSRLDRTAPQIITVRGFGYKIASRSPGLPASSDDEPISVTDSIASEA